MGDFLQPWHLMVIFFFFGIFFLIPAIFYILTLQKALNQCAPVSRTMVTGLAGCVLAVPDGKGGCAEVTAAVPQPVSARAAATSTRTFAFAPSWVTKALNCQRVLIRSAPSLSVNRQPTGFGT